MRSPRPLTVLLALCLLLALAPGLPWRAAPVVPSPARVMPAPARPPARWGAPEALAPVGGRAAMAPLSPARLPDGLYPAVLATLERTASPAYRPQPLPVTQGQPAGYAATNSAARLDLRFDARGLTLRQAGRPGTLHLALAGIGYGSRLTIVGAARLRGSGNEVRYRWPRLEEWYRNGPLGLEQGFTLAAPPAPRGSGPLILRLRLAGALAPRLFGDTLLLGSDGLRYSGLYAADATGRRLAARLALAPAPGGWVVSLLVNDRGARYPLSIDPTFTLQSTLADPSADAGGFGAAVALSADGLTALVGAPLNANGGAAFVFSRSSAGVPFSTTPIDSLTDPGPGADNFGAAVALSADGLTALVGALFTFKGSTPIAGAAYVYSRASASAAFPTSPTTTLPDPGPGSDEFGIAVALSGDGLTALVGAIGTGGGAAYVYSRANAGAAFLTSPTTTLPDPGSNSVGAGDQFGFAVALSADGLTALIGAVGTTKGSTFDAGAAYVYSRASTRAAFATSPTTTLPDPGSGADEFGFAVALSGDGLTALIGAPENSVGGLYLGGAAYVYSRSSAGATFPASPTTTLSHSAGASQFGGSVALSGDGLTALVGADQTSTGSNAGEGVADLYSRASAAATFPTKPTTALADPGSGAFDRFGSAVALSGDGLTALIGADETTVLANAGAQSGPGTAYVYSRASTSTTFPTNPSTTLPNPHPGPGNDRFGAAVALSADGLTALIGAPNLVVEGGAAFVFSRSSTSVPFPANPTATLLDPGSHASDGFGAAVALSGDGLTALIGAGGTANGAGAAYVYSRTSAAAAFPSSPTSTVSTPTGASGFGSDVALSGDGLTALIGADGTTNGAGAAYVYSRTSAAAAFPSSPTNLPDPGSGADNFGDAVALSGAGLTALIGADGTANGAGAAYVYSRASTSATFSTTPTTLPDPGSNSGSVGDQFGNAVALSGDGLTALIGADLTSSAGEGAAYVYSRASAAAAFPTKPTTTLLDPGSGASDSFGSAVVLSGDGLAALIGADQSEEQFNAGAGAAYVYSRASAGATFPSSPTSTVPTPASALAFGSAVALSGDGLTALVGALATTEQRIDDAGAAYVFTATGATQTKTIQMQSGWNLISLPLQPTGTLTAADLLGALLQNNHASKLVALYELSATSWSPSLVERAGHPALGTPFPLAVGSGYLLYSDVPNSYSEQGTVPATGPIWALGRGWNLVGLSAASAALPAATVLSDVLAGGGGGQLASIYELSGTQWSPSLLERAGRPPVGTPFDLQAQGQGYLLYTDHTATISPGAAPLAPGQVRHVLPGQPPAAGEPTGGTALPALPRLPN